MGGPGDPRRVDSPNPPEARAFWRDHLKERLVTGLLVLPPTLVFLSALDEDWADLRANGWWAGLMFAAGIVLGRWWRVWPFDPSVTMRSKLITIGSIGAIGAGFILFMEARR